MNLRDLVGGNKNEFFWSLLIEPGWVQAGIWTINDETAKVVALSNPVAWDKEEDLSTSADTALSAAVQTLPEDAAEPNKVVFGVPASWVVDGQIRKERLDSLRMLCSKLTLTPSGFVTLPEAVSFYIKSVEGSPLSAVVVSVGREMVEVAVFRLGNIIGTTAVARSVSLFDDVVEAVGRFNLKDPVPSRFILFDGKDGELAEAKQTLLENSWEDLTKIKLLHTPKIEILSGEQKIEAVSLGGAAEIAKVSKVQMLVEESEAKDPVPGEANLGEGDNFGFVVEKDIAELEAMEKTKEEPRAEVSKNKFAQVGATARSFVAKLSPYFSGGGKPIFLGAGAFITVSVLLFAFWWFYPKATVTIFVAPQTLEENVTVIVDTNLSTVDLEEKRLPGHEVKTVESGEKTTQTTGNKLVGEKARGEIEIRNGRSDPLTLAAGTPLISSNSLEFLVEKSVEIPAQTSPGSPGSGKVTVVADDVGSEYNLSKDETFKVSNYPKAEVDGVATTDFSGGSSRQIQAVSQEDRDRLLEELVSEVESKAKESLTSSTPDDQFFIEGSIENKVVSQTFSGKVGDEADTLKLNATVEVIGVTVAKSNLFDLASTILSGLTPQGYVLRESQLVYEFDLASKDEEIYELEGSIAANLLPEVNTDNVAREIRGKYTSVVLGYLENIPGFVRAQININPRFPGRLGTLPHVVKNITVEVASDK